MEPSNRKRMADAATSHVTEGKEELPSVTTIEIDTMTPHGKPYKGVFTYHVPTLGDRIDISRMRAEYLGQTKIVDIDDEGVGLADMLAYLHATIEDRETDPVWWKESKRGVDLYDYAPILALYAAARAYEATFLGGSTDSGDDKTEDGETPVATDSGSVERDVQSSPERRTLIEIDGKGGVRAGAATQADSENASGVNSNDNR